MQYLLLMQAVLLGLQGRLHGDGGVQPLLKHGVLGRTAQGVHHGTLLTLRDGICKGNTS